VLGGEAGAHSCVIDVIELVAVCGNQLLAGEEKGVITVCRGIAKPGGIGTGAARDQVDAAARGMAGARALRLPLIDVGDAVDVGGQQRIFAVEEDAAAVGGEVAGEELERGGVVQEVAFGSQGSGTVGRRTGGVAGNADQLFLRGAIAEDLGAGSGFLNPTGGRKVVVAGEALERAEEQGATVRRDTGGLRFS
jgi:hypothetical protein